MKEYYRVAENKEIHVYTQVDSHFITEDMFAKLKIFCS